MKRLSIIIRLVGLFISANFQLQVKIVDATTNEPLLLASVLLFSHGKPDMKVEFTQLKVDF